MARMSIGVAALAATAGFASAQVFTDAGAWTAAAAGPIVAPDYSTLAVQNFAAGANDFNGLFTVNVQTTGGGTATFNGVQNFVFDFQPLTIVEFVFAQPITGFSAEWSNTFVQDGFRVSTPFADYDLESIVSPLDQAFIGVHEGAGFTTLTLTTTNNPGMGDDFVFFREFNWVVPAPGGVAGLAMFGLALGVRRRRG